MSEWRKARGIKVAFAVIGAIGAVAVIAYVRHVQPVGTLQPLPPAVQTASQMADHADGNEPLPGEPPPLGSVFGYNRPAPPAVGLSIGPAPGEADTPDLSTPAVAVYTILSLIDQAATSKLPPCLLEEAEDPLGDLYPRCLGHPVGLVEVIEDGESAQVIWDATVHTAFSRHGKQWSPGETVTLTARLVQIDGFWKLWQLHDGGEDGDQQHDAPPH